VIVVCGSYGDMKRLSEILRRLRKEHGDENVFPTREHLERSGVCIEAHHRGKGETAETIEIRSELMKSYFDHIDTADLVVVMNEKNGKEYYGTGTTIEIGYALAKGKQIHFTRVPTNANILSLLKIEEAAMRWKEYEDKGLWKKFYAMEEAQKTEGLEEHYWVEGEDGRELFDRMVIEAVKGKEALDVGCGSGEFTLAVAASAEKVVGLDFSERAIAKAVENRSSKAVRNVEFRLAEAHELPFPSGSFDVVISRRGPATDSSKTIREVYRVLRKGGQLMEITIGEKDKLNWKEIFGKGQNYPFKEKVAAEKQRLLARVGFTKINTQEFEATEYFGSIKDVVMRLETAPILSDFDKETYKPQVKQIEKTFTTAKGIRTNRHRVIVIATK